MNSHDPEIELSSSELRRERLAQSTAGTASGERKTRAHVKLLRRSYGLHFVGIVGDYDALRTTCRASNQLIALGFKGRLQPAIFLIGLPLSVTNAIQRSVHLLEN